LCILAELTPQSATRRQTFRLLRHVEAVTDSCRLTPNKFTDTPLVKNNSATDVSFVTLQLYHGLPWFTMVNHGISYRCTMVYHGRPIPW